MFLAVGETHGTRNTQKRASSNNLFLSSSEARAGGKETATIRRAGCEAARALGQGYVSDKAFLALPTSNQEPTLSAA